MNEDAVIRKLLEHDIKLDALLTRTDFDQFKNTYFNGQDQAMRILTRLDEERVFTNKAIGRIQDELNEQRQKIMEHEEWLTKIKTKLQIA